MGAYADAGIEARERRQAQQKRERLKALLEEMPLADVLAMVRDRFASSTEITNKRGQAIIVRSIEDAMVWLAALENHVLWTPPVGG